MKEPLFWKFAQQACAGFGCRDQGPGIVKLCYVLNLVFWRLLREGVFKVGRVLNRFRASARGCVFGKSVQNILVKPRRINKIVLFFFFAASRKACARGMICKMVIVGAFPKGRFYLLAEIAP